MRAAQASAWWPNKSLGVLHRPPCTLCRSSAGLRQARAHGAPAEGSLLCRDAAAIASARAGELYGLEVLDESIQDMADNITRFLVLSRDPVISAPGDPRPHKTSLAFALPEGPGRLFKALSVFALRSLDICKARAIAECIPRFSDVM